MRNRQFDLIEIVKAHPEILGIGLDEGAAIMVPGDTFEVLGDNHNIWMSERDGDGWSEARNLFLPIKRTDEMWWISVTNDGTLYLTLGREANQHLHQLSR